MNRMDASGVSHSVYSFIKYSVITGISLSVIVLTITSFLVHDTYWIQKHPKIFTSEALVMALLTSIPVLYISYMREGAIISTIQEFTILFLKIIFLHVTFQLSGVYSVLFPKSAAPK
jgi:hypothetical protein